jgi:hypothetical protein
MNKETSQNSQAKSERMEKLDRGLNRLICWLEVGFMRRR